SPFGNFPDFATAAPSALAARRIGGQCAMIFVVFSTSPNTSRSLANSTCRIGSPPSSSISRTRGIRITSLSVAHEPAGPRAGLLAILKGRRAGHECRAISVGPLHEAAAPGRQIMHDLRLVQTQPVKVDQVDVGAQSRLEAAAVMESEEIGGLAGLHLDELGQGQARAAPPVARPMRQHVGRQAGVDNLTTMRAAV